MWKTFQHGDNLYMIKIVQDDNLRLVLTDFQNIWVQDLSKEELLQQFQDANPLFDIKIDEVAFEVIEAINSISDCTNVEISEADEGLKLLLNTMKSEYKIQFKFSLFKPSSEIFLKEITVPLIQTVKHLEEHQNMLINLLHKKDRELEEYKLEKGLISRDDLITEKFDEEKLSSIDDKSMMNVFGQNEMFWNCFVGQHGNIEANIEETHFICVENSMEIEEVEVVVPPDRNARNLTAKSKKVYELVYRRFMDYCKENTISSISENDLLAYFIHLSKKYKSSSLWSSYSMLKATLNEKNSINIGEYNQLRAFLKKQAVGYKAKKSKVFTKAEVRKFLLGAPDDKYLSVKAVLIVATAGALSCDELVNLKTDNVEDIGSKILVTTRSKKSRTFVITQHLNIVKKYMSSRPVGLTSRRFFYKYVDGQGHRQLIGIHKIGSMPRAIATYLKLTDAEDYTGHCFRSMSFLFDHGLERTSSERDPLGDNSDYEGGIKEEPFSVKQDPWNHIKRKRKVYSSKTVTKKGKGINYDN